jgi:ribonuclease HI
MIEIYTDGSCLTNPGNGGWAAIINDDGKIKKISGSEKNTTNNRMELLAPINALREMSEQFKNHYLYRLSVRQTWNNRVDK